MKTFTQEEVNSLLARERKKLETQVQTLSARIEELLATAGQRETEVATLRAAAEQYRQERRKNAIRQALIAARVLPQAIDVAEKLFESEHAIEDDGTGALIVRAQDGSSSPIDVAAKAFIGAHDFLEKAQGLRGAGTMGAGNLALGERPPIWKKTLGLETQDPTNLVREGLNQ